MKGPEQGRSQHRIRAKIDRVQASVDWSPGGHRKSPSPSLRFPLTWWLSFRLVFTADSEPRDFTTAVLSLLLLLLLPDNSCSFVPLRSLISETCSRASPVSRLRSQDDSGQTWLLFCQESPAWFSLSGGPPSLSAYKIIIDDWKNMVQSLLYQLMYHAFRGISIYS